MVATAAEIWTPEQCYTNGNPLAFVILGWVSSLKRLLHTYFPYLHLPYIHPQPIFPLLSNQTIRKVKFLSKNSILTKTQHFHEFFTQNFLTIFLVKSKLSTAKKSRTAAFSRVLTQNNSTIFLGKSKVIFWTKK